VTTATVIFTKISGNSWNATGTQNYEGGGGHFISGRKTLAGTLDRVSITTSNGTDAFDAGSINILYE
jgi:hypothetical protein